jgi:putative cell wall-binding protein
VVGQEIIRLHPTKVVILGGPGAISDDAVTEVFNLLALLP